MDLTNLTVEELKKRLDGLDKTESPHVALELSNEISRRTVVIDEIKQSQTRGIRAVKRSLYIATACISAFLLMSFFNPPEMKKIIFTLGFSILLTYSYVRSWTKGASLLYGICIAIVAIFSSRFLSGFIEPFQYFLLLIGVSMATVYTLRDKILKLIEENKL